MTCAGGRLYLVRTDVKHVVSCAGRAGGGGVYQLQDQSVTLSQLQSILATQGARMLRSHTSDNTPASVKL